MPALYLIFFNSPKEYTDVVSGLSFVKKFPEHFDASHDTRLRRLDADDFDRVVYLHASALNTTRDYGAAAFDRENVLDRHQERFIEFPDRCGHVLIYRIHELLDRFFCFGITLKRFQSRAADHRNFVAGESVFGQKLSDFHLDEIEKFFVLHHVAFVHKYDNRGHVYLFGKQNVLAGLGHRTIRC